MKEFALPVFVLLSVANVEKPRVEAEVVAVPVTLLLVRVALTMIEYVVAGLRPLIVVLADVPFVVENVVQELPLFNEYSHLLQATFAEADSVQEFAVTPEVEADTVGGVLSVVV